MTDNMIKIQDSYTLPHGRDEVWATLNNPDILAVCIKGCSFVERASPQQFNAVIQARLGKFTKDFIIALNVEDENAPAIYTLSSEVSAGLLGTANGQAHVKLDAIDKDSTYLSYVATIKASGVLNKALPTIQNAAHQRIHTFFDSFVKQLNSA